MLSLGCYTIFFLTHRGLLTTLGKILDLMPMDILGSANVKSIDSLMNQLKELSLSQFARGPTSSVSSNPTQSTDVHSVQSSTNPNGSNNQEGIRRKDIITVRVGKMVIKPRTIMRRWVLMLERENEKNVR
jgi:hypothetical protein